MYVWRPHTYSYKYFSCSSLLFVVCFCLHHRGLTTTTITFMNELAKLGIPLTAAKGEFLESLLCQQVEALSTLRLKLLSEGMGKDLCDSSDDLRVRLSRKLAKDIWTIFRFICRKSSLQRSLLKNGNHSSQYLAKSHSAVANHTSATAVVTENTQSTNRNIQGALAQAPHVFSTCAVCHVVLNTSHRRV